MKNTLAKTLALALCSLLCLGASALELEQVEAVDEVVAAEAETVLQDEVTYPSEHETYGTLIYYNDFSNFTTATDSTYINTDILGDIKFKVYAGGDGGTHISAIVSDPLDENNTVFKVEYSNGSAYSRAVVEPTAKLNLAGNYTVVCDYNLSPLSSTLTSLNFQNMFYFSDNANDRLIDPIITTISSDWVKNQASPTLTSTTSNGYFFKKIYLVNCTGTAGSFYIDNLRIYYNPIVEVDLGELPEGTTVRKIKKGENGYAAFSDTTIVCGTELPELYTVNKSYSFLGWQDEDGNFIKTAPAKPCTVTAKWQEHKPGLNLLTGTTGLADFEDSLDRQYLVQNQCWGLTYEPTKRISNPFKTTEGYTVKNNTSEGMLHQAFTVRDKIEEYISWEIPVRLEAGRRYTFRWDVYTNSPYANVGWLLNSTASGKNTTVSSITDTQEYASFGTRSYTVTPTEERQAVSLQYKVNTGSGPAASYDIYFDNFAVYSDYKVTYHYYDGSTESVWYSANGAKTYTPNKTAIYNGDDLKKFIGWSTVENATEPMATVTLANEDFDLYPVWKEFTAGDEYLLSAYVNANAATTLTTALPYESAELLKADGSSETIVSDKAVTDAATGATLQATGNSTLKVTPVNVSGEFKVRFTLTNGSVLTSTVHVVSGKYWKPGLNTVTGTTDGFTVDGLLLDDVKKAFDTVGNYQIGTNPFTNGINARATALYTTSQFSYIHNVNNYSPAIEKERPFVYSYDILSTSLVYTMINGSSANHIYKDSLGRSAGAWKHEAVTVNLSKDTCATPNLPTGNAKDGTYWIGTGGQSGSFGTYADFAAGTKNRYLYLDNISLIPYYKATYVQLDGTTVTDYFLYDEAGSILTAYTPDTEKLGTGYYALTENGTPIAADTAVALNNADITLYAVVAPTNSGKTSVRTGANAGVRFMANIEANDAVSEFGFIVARTDVIAKKGATTDDLKIGTSGVTENTDTALENNFNGKTDKGFSFVGARNYVKGEGVDKYTVEDDGTYSYNGVIVGLDSSYKSYDTDTDGKRITYTTRYDVVFAARPYAVVNGTYFYGSVSTASMAGAAESIQNDANASETDKAFAADILANTKIEQ